MSCSFFTAESCKACVTSLNNFQIRKFNGCKDEQQHELQLLCLLELLVATLETMIAWSRRRRRRHASRGLMHHSTFYVPFDQNQHETVCICGLRMDAYGFERCPRI